MNRWIPALALALVGPTAWAGPQRTTPATPWQVGDTARVAEQRTYQVDLSGMQQALSVQTQIQVVHRIEVLHTDAQGPDRLRVVLEWAQEAEVLGDRERVRTPGTLGAETLYERSGGQWVALTPGAGPLPPLAAWVVTAGSSPTGWRHGAPLPAAYQAWLQGLHEGDASATSQVALAKRRDPITVFVSFDAHALDEVAVPVHGTLTFDGRSGRPQGLEAIGQAHVPTSLQWLDAAGTTTGTLRLEWGVEYNASALPGVSEPAP